MANDLNQCNFIGRLGKDVECRYLTSGDPVVNFSVAVSSSWKNKAGEKQESTEWVNVVAFGKLAEICSEYLKKGSQVFVSGRMKTEKYTDKQGIEKYTTKIVAETMQLLGSRDVEKNSSKNSESEDCYAQSSGNQRHMPPAQSALPSDMDDRIPF